MRHYYSEHFMTFVLAELRKGKSATQIKIDVTAPSMKTLLAVTFAKALSEEVRKCWFGLQKAFPTRGSGTGPALTGVIDQGRSSKVGCVGEVMSL